MSVLFGNGDGMFQWELAFATGNGPSSPVGDAAHIHSPFGAQGMNAAQAIRNRAIPKRMLDTFSIRPFVDLCPSAG